MAYGCGWNGAERARSIGTTWLFVGLQQATRDQGGPGQMDLHGAGGGGGIVGSNRGANLGHARRARDMAVGGGRWLPASTRAIG